MAGEFSDQDLQAFLDEGLPVDEAARIEHCLRDDDGLRRRLAVLLADADFGEHSVGAVWRRRRLSCADRSTLGSYVLNVLADDERQYLEFHLNVIGCRYCTANLDEIRERLHEQPAADGRRRRIFESSIGRLRSV